MKESIGVIGGTGKQGSAFAKRVARLGYPVRIGSRSADRGSSHARNLMEIVEQSEITGGNNHYAAEADIVVLAIPFDQVNVLLDPLEELLVNKIILDMTVNLQFGKQITARLHNDQSSYEYIRDKFNQSEVVACLKTISYVLLDTEDVLEQSDFQMTTSDSAYAFSSQLVSEFGLIPVRVEGEVHSHTLERMVALSIQLNKSYKGSHVGFLLKHLKK